MPGLHHSLSVSSIIAEASLRHCTRHARLSLLNLILNRSVLYFDLLLVLFLPLNFPNCSSPRETLSTFASFMRSYFFVSQPKTCLSELRRAFCPEESLFSFCSGIFRADNLFHRYWLRRCCLSLAEALPSLWYESLIFPSIWKSSFIFDFHKMRKPHHLTCFLPAYLSKMGSRTILGTINFSKA